ncbi:alpha/beta family hydrolase [Alicyclobacillus sp. ALC3]|uniref:alpha/beta family hydrolase n=1 Tax=Alicyclobacillus sp. ALC3 TaxID=2796143 RepID=UPI0023787174|nr:alpha/beta family hydrolase [Alicyclobacillus sp. ALC3]WDL95692.1 hypothetical protein JC200_15095 [Alicyclobacillus sp. ALC3]
MATLEVVTRWGTIPARYQYLQQTTPSSKLAVVFPGAAYNLDAPLMWYAARAAFQAGCDVIGVEYGYQANRTDFDADDLGHLVDEVTGALENEARERYSAIVFIGKSLGTVVQTEVSRKVSLPVRNHVFLTPVRRVVSFIRQSENALVVVGDADPLFGASEIAQISNSATVQLHVIAGGDHALETEDYSDSIDVLKKVAILCNEFCSNSI